MSEVKRMKIDETVAVFDNFVIEETLAEFSDTKRVCIKGKFSGGDNEEKVAVVILEKTPFDEKTNKFILSSSTSTESVIDNDIYKTYTSYPSNEYNGKHTACSM